MSNKPLGARLVPHEKKEWVEKYPLRLSLNQLTKPTPVVMGIPWYTDFDRPIQKADGTWWVGLKKNDLGKLRGGHCVCIPFDPKRDLLSWYLYYDQGNEGACVGFGSSRAMSLLNRKMYDARWLWNEAKKIDEWSDTNPGDDEGTSVAAAMDVLRIQGHKRKAGGKIVLSEGIEVNRWATSVDDLFEVLQNETYKKLGALPFLNSWGKEYPKLVYMPCETHDVLLKRGFGEYTMFTDR